MGFVSTGSILLGYKFAKFYIFRRALELPAIAWNKIFQGERGEKVILFFGLVAILQREALSWASYSYNAIFSIKILHDTTVVRNIKFSFLESLFHSRHTGRVSLAASFSGLVLVYILFVLFVWLSQRSE